MSWNRINTAGNSRRKFIKKSIATTGAVFLSGGLFALDDFAQIKSVNIGVIGAGSRGQGLMNLVNDIPGLQVTAFADVLPFRLDEARQLCPEAMVYDDYEKLLNSANVDAVIISTPFGTHDEIALDALDAGKHIYCEKTMAKGLNEIQAVVDKSRALPQLVFQTGHQYHSSPLYVKAREIIRSGYLGEVTAYHCQWNRNGDWRRDVPDPKWERQVNWRMYKENSGGLVAELMSHQIDFINWVTDSHPARISGFGGIDHWNDGRETFDNVHLLFEYPSGLDASFTCTTTNGYDDYKIKVLGKSATMILDYTEGFIYLEDSKMKELGDVDGVSGATVKAWDAGQASKIPAPGNDPTLDALSQFRESIINKTPVISDIKTGALTSKCVQLSLDALYEKKIVNWDDSPKLSFE